MTFHRKLELVKAIELIATELDREPLEVAQLVCLTDEKRARILSDAVIEVNRFRDASIEERAKMLGYKITVNED